MVTEFANRGNPDIEDAVLCADYFANAIHAFACSLDSLRVAHALGDRLYGIRLDTPAERGRVTTREYEAGHMMYIHEGELARLKRDVVEFVRGALAAK